MPLEEKKIASPWPYFTVGVVWIVCGFVFPLYQLGFILATLVASIVAFVASYMATPKLTIHVEKQVAPTGNETADAHIQITRDSIKRMSALAFADDAGNTSQGVSAQRERLVSTTTKIQDFVEKYPAKARQLNTFMDYYLVTTVELLEKYDHLATLGQASENIQNSRQTIVETLPVLVTAFEKQLDALFADKALDISAETKVLQNLLSMEGLS